VILKDCLATAEKTLQPVAADRSRVEARLLLAEVLNLEPGQLLAHDDRLLTDDEVAKFSSLVIRRSQFEPLAYILGRKEFYGRNFTVNAHVLIPRPETETLIEEVISWAKEKKEPLRILDIGTGSGCILLTLLSEFDRLELENNHTGVGIDISKKAIGVAQYNRDKFQSSGADFIEADMSFWEPGERFDIIVSNPPYIPTKDLETLSPDILNYEPRLALDGGSSGIEYYEMLVDYFENSLKPQGLMALETYDENQRIEIAALFKGAEITTKGSILLLRAL